MPRRRARVTRRSRRGERCRVRRRHRSTARGSSRLPARSWKEKMRGRRVGRLSPKVAREWMDGSRKKLKRNANGIEDFAQGGFRRLRFSLQRSVARAGDDTMREDRDGKLLKIVGQAEVAPVEEGASLGGTLEHQG